MESQGLGKCMGMLYGVANIVIKRYNGRLLKCRGSLGIRVPEQKKGHPDILKTS